MGDSGKRDRRRTATAATAVAAVGARRAGLACGHDRRIRVVRGAAAEAAVLPREAAVRSSLEKLARAPRELWERIVDAAAAETKGVVSFVRDRVMPRLEAAVRASTAPRLQFSALPLASTATALAPDASHPHVTAKFAPSLPKKERDGLRAAIAIKLKGTRIRSSHACLVDFGFKTPPEVLLIV